MQAMNCPFCGAENSIVQKTVDQEFEYKGRTIVLEGYKEYECSHCAESFESPDENRDIDSQIVAFQRKVDGLLLPCQIKKLRTSLGFTQKDFANLLGVGEKSFTRYERGIVVQGRSMDNQLRLIKSNPGWALEVLNRAGQGRDRCGEIKLIVHETIKATGTYGMHDGYSPKNVTMSFSGTAHENKRDTTSRVFFCYK